MYLSAIKASIVDWLILKSVPLTFTIVVLLIYVVLNIVIARFVKRAERQDARRGAALKVIKTVRFVTAFFGVMMITVAWGINFGSVAIFATTTITLLGVALFASWSLLSNVTAYFVLLFHSSFTRGRFVRIIEADNYVEGYVANLSLFSLELITEDDSRVVYPNNILLSRVVIVDPQDRLHGVGKIVNPPQATAPTVKNSTDNRT